MDGGENEDAEATDPEVHGIEGSEIFGEPDDEACAHEGDEAEEADGAASIQIQAFFHKGDGGLEHGERAGDGSDEEKKEPEEAEKLACGHVGENEGERLKTEAKGAAHCAGGSKKEESGGDGDEAPEANFAKFVARDGGGRAEGDIVPFFEVAGVVNHDPEADGEAEEDLACGGHPHFGIAERFEQAWKTPADIPHVGEASEDVSFGLGGVGSAKGENAEKDEQGTEDKKGHAPKADFFDPSTKASIDKEEIKDDAGEETEDGEAEAVGEKFAVGLESNERGEVIGVGGGIHTEVHLASEIFPGISQAPRFDPQVVHVDDDGDDEAENA